VLSRFERWTPLQQWACLFVGGPAAIALVVSGGWLLSLLPNAVAWSLASLAAWALICFAVLIGAKPDLDAARDDARRVQVPGAPGDFHQKRVGTVAGFPQWKD
jgi:hypothetical protein